MVSGQSVNSSKFSCMTSLPARMKMIQCKMKELEWSQYFSNYMSLGFFPEAQELEWSQYFSNYMSLFFFQRLKGCLLRSP